MDLTALLTQMVERGASDLFLKAGGRVAIRVDGDVAFLTDHPLGEADCVALVEQVAGPRTAEVLGRQESDLATAVAGLGRFRCNVYRQQGQLGLVLRHIRSQIPGLAELGLPVAPLELLAGLSRGLVLVTGVAGSGKSTTLAAMVEHVNRGAARHIVTVEDPIEYAFEDGRSIISQRELGADTASFADALKHVVRQSPDVILIGEMRDRETVQTALSAAETGHLVLSTLHTVNAVQTVERIITFFPPYQHALVRLQLSMGLKGVVSQRLLRRADGVGRVPAVEILIATPTVQEILFEGRTREIEAALRDGAYHGCQTFNQALKALVDAGTVTAEDALQVADDPDELKLDLRGIGRGAGR